MAGCEEVPPMDAREGSRKRRVREFVATWFLERCLANDEQETSIDLGKRLSSEFMMPLKEKAKLVAADGERKRFSGAEAAIDKIQTEKMDKAKHAAVDKIQAEKMDKTVVEVLDGEKNGFSTITSGAPVETEKMDKCAESDHVSTETPIDDTEYLTEIAKLLNKSEDWIEERRQQDKENAARSKRISDYFVQFCLNQQGCLVEDDDEEEDDDEYDARFARMEKFTAELWNQHNDFSGLNDHYNPEEDNMVAA